MTQLLQSRGQSQVQSNQYSGAGTPSSTSTPENIESRRGQELDLFTPQGASATAGVPLPKNLQTKFERSLSDDLSGVRIHADDASAAKSSVLRARAFTFGSHIHFARGQWDPSSAASEQLLAHEVAHTVQQAKGSTATKAKLEVSSAGDASEVEADRAAEAMMLGEPTSVSSGPTLIARRQEGTGFVSTPGGRVAEERHGTVREIDEMRASLVEAFRALIPQMSNSELIKEALRLDEKLWRPEVEVGRREKAAIAQTLIQIYGTLDERIRAAPLDAKGRPMVKGIQWQEDDPLGGNLLAIAPFGNIDLWHTFIVKPSDGAAKRPTHRKRKRVPKKEHIEFEDENIEVKVPAPETLIKRAIKTVQTTDERWKDRAVRMLNLLADPSVDDEVLKINEYIYLNKGFAVPKFEPSKATFHARKDLAALLRKASTDAAVLTAVRLMVEAIHQGYHWAKQEEVRYVMGGGSSASEVEKAAFNWISEKQHNPKSVYSAWED